MTLSVLCTLWYSTGLHRAPLYRERVETARTQLGDTMFTVFFHLRA
nr:MAG TPA: hypothetical protein [Caudoviricetes sp.]